MSPQQAAQRAGTFDTRLTCHVLGQRVPAVHPGVRAHPQLLTISGGPARPQSARRWPAPRPARLPAGSQERSQVFSPHTRTRAPEGGAGRYTRRVHRTLDTHGASGRAAGGRGGPGPGARVEAVSVPFGRTPRGAGGTETPPPSPGRSQSTCSGGEGAAEKVSAAIQGTGRGCRPSPKDAGPEPHGRKAAPPRHGAPPRRSGGGDRCRRLGRHRFPVVVATDADKASGESNSCRTSHTDSRSQREH